MGKRGRRGIAARWVDPSTTNAGWSHELYKRLSFGHLFLRDIPRGADERKGARKRARDPSLPPPPTPFSKEGRDADVREIRTYTSPPRPLP